ncbi:MAG TPA: DNA polymerase III subunit gamma/tau, partial [Actinomycetota bacterium]|nr:DNA polymerase III subunit gamma/tau [Actinomycetota bacterium]
VRGHHLDLPDLPRFPSRVEAGARRPEVDVADDKPYQSLYRKYRPQGPSEVLGQDHVIRALSGAVREGRLAHAFLLCGPRGTGKTSTARILAKMVNCESGPTPEPCGSCDQCVSVRDGQHLDVVEIDAASHGGVDDARDLREKAPTAPVQGREKVYIIDEAQRLSREAFDALLKVFEEPPVGVRFVLATTEPHKMPATIVGRCQRFDFRRVPVEAVADHLERIAKDEGMSLTSEAAHTIARQTEGSVRDALSLLDQASVLGAGEIGEDIVLSLIGSGRSDVQYALGDAVAVGDAKGVFELVSRLVQEGQDLRHVTNEVLAHFRNLLLVKTAPGQHDLLDATDEEAERLTAQAAKYSAAELGRVIALLLAAQTDMRWTTSPRLSLELALIRSTIPETDAAPEALVSRLERLERVAGIQAGGGSPQSPATTTPAPPVPTPANPTEAADAVGPDGSGTGEAADPAPPADEKNGRRPAKRTAASSAEEAASGPVPPGTEAGTEAGAVPVLGAGTSAVDVSMLRSNWPRVISHLRGSGKAVLPSFLEIATPAAFDGTTLELVFPPERPYGVQKVLEREGELRQALQDLFGIAPAISCVIREPVAGPAEPIEDEPLSEEEALARLAAELGATPATEDGS